jgi:hypothetical protein
VPDQVEGVGEQHSPERGVPMQEHGQQGDGRDEDELLKNRQGERRGRDSTQQRRARGIMRSSSACFASHGCKKTTSSNLWTMSATTTNHSTVSVDIHQSPDMKRTC